MSGDDAAATSHCDDLRQQVVDGRGAWFNSLSFRLSGDISTENPTRKKKTLARWSGRGPREGACRMATGLSRIGLPDLIAGADLSALHRRSLHRMPSQFISARHFGLGRKKSAEGRPPKEGVKAAKKYGFGKIADYWPKKSAVGQCVFMHAAVEIRPMLPTALT